MGSERVAAGSLHLSRLAVVVSPRLVVAIVRILDYDNDNDGDWFKETASTLLVEKPLAHFEVRR
jgi:hypothetical protein